MHLYTSLSSDPNLISAYDLFQQLKAKTKRAYNEWIVYYAWDRYISNYTSVSKSKQKYQLLNGLILATSAVFYTIMFCYAVG